MRENRGSERRHKYIDVETAEAIKAVAISIAKLDPTHNDMFPDELTAPWNRHDKDASEDLLVPLVGNPEQVAILQDQALRVREELGMHAGRDFDFYQLAKSLDVFVTTIGSSDIPGFAKHRLLVQAPHLIPSILLPMKAQWETSDFEHILVLNDTHSPECLRFNAAKRMSHLLLGHPCTTINAVEPHDYASPNNLEANTFATFLLLPTVDGQHVPNSDMFEPSLARARLELEEMLAQ